MDCIYITVTQSIFTVQVTFSIVYSHWGNLGVEGLDQGHLGKQTRGARDQTTDILVSGRPPHLLSNSSPNRKVTQIEPGICPCSAGVNAKLPPTTAKYADPDVESSVGCGLSEQLPD